MGYYRRVGPSSAPWCRERREMWTVGWLVEMMYFFGWYLSFLMSSLFFDIALCFYSACVDVYYIDLLFYLMQISGFHHTLSVWERGVLLLYVQVWCWLTQYTINNKPRSHYTRPAKTFRVPKSKIYIFSSLPPPAPPPSCSWLLDWSMLSRTLRAMWWMSRWHDGCFVCTS